MLLDNTHCLGQETSHCSPLGDPELVHMKLLKYDTALEPELMNMPDNVVMNNQ